MKCELMRTCENVEFQVKSVVKPETSPWTSIESQSKTSSSKLNENWIDSVFLQSEGLPLG